MAQKKHAEVAIIGGGIMGSAISYYVAKAGLDCMLIEKNDIASGTSSRCDGNITIVDKDPGFDSKMSLVSQELTNELKDDLNLDFEYRELGSILVCDNDQEMEAAAEWVEIQKKAGLKFNLLDREDIRQESPYFADDIPGGLECETDSLINPYLYCYSLVDRAQEYGLKLYTQTEVTNIKKEDDFIIETTNGTFTAKKVVNAAGVWAPYIGEMLGLDIPIVPRKGHIMVGSRQKPVMMRNVMEFGYLMNKFQRERIADPETLKYGVALVLEPTESQNFLLGSSREFVGFDGRVDINVVNAMAKRALRFFPKMDDFNMIRAYTGFRPWTEDHLPIVSPVESVPGFFIAAGHEGDGISLATVTGKLIEEMLTEKETIIPVDPLRFDRFEKVPTA
ncbi:sarcosine oxidase subunit beta [Cerasibacillus quisquiliarum]|uniref:Sarcosine oxidase subunit beta n=1 Tax=Cerasibacillus quisquiliarum TaxID=227865 RepID=A0A511V0Z2_9BACI|nr:FAD-dependent oxidoreductase [Cerasibacillus quisquiliarum]MBB5146703.1 sarcosine oxidase subunit beta [Cerasibacillus quisquiliarum]GEN31403.1 sarcosine oxidase subunit beta [Cerasibacillus quisquiliarum]